VRHDLLERTVELRTEQDNHDVTAVECDHLAKQVKGLKAENENLKEVR
jgi:hypothetical protein